MFVWIYFSHLITIKKKGSMKAFHVLCGKNNFKSLVVGVRVKGYFPFVRPTTN